MNYKRLREIVGMTTLSFGMMGCADLSLGYINEKTNEITGAREPYTNRFPEQFDYVAIGFLLSSGVILPKERKKRKRDIYSSRPNSKIW